MSKTIQTPTDVVKIEKSGVRFNAWDTNGVKRTSEITTGARKRAFEGNYLLGRFQMKNGKFQWRKVADSMVETPSPVNDSSSVDVPTCLLYTSPSPRDKRQSRMPSSA